MIRRFFPGSEWLYFKVYLPINLSDTFLSYILRECVNLSMDLQYVDKWFFIRYTDPFFHLRIRFHVKSSESYSTKVSQIFINAVKKFKHNESIWKISIDTYVRELERYGTNEIELCETFFSNDSQNTVSLLSCIDIEENDKRWKLAFSKIDIFLSIIFPELKTRHAFIKRMSEAFLREFNHFDNHHDLDRMYRVRKKELLTLTDNAKNEYSDLNKWIDFCANENLDWIFNGPNWESRLQSIIHMLVNRIISVEPRKYEMIMYFFLERHYNLLFYKQNSI